MKNNGKKNRLREMGQGLDEKKKAGKNRFVEYHVFWDYTALQCTQ